MATAVLLVFLGALSRLIPHPPNFVALGALALYAGARLPRRLALGRPARGDGALGLRARLRHRARARSRSMRVADLRGLRRRSSSLGRLARERSPARPPRSRALGRRVGPLLPRLEPRRVGRAIRCTRRRRRASCSATRPRSRSSGTRSRPISLGTAVLFGARRARRGASGARGGARRAPAAFLLAGSCPRRGAQQPPPASEDVVVTATSVPEDEKDVGSAITVITRRGDREARDGRRCSDAPAHRCPASTSCSRARPARSDLALHARHELDADARARRRRADELAVLRRATTGPAMTTENIERIEIVRGPFSALYGSDAIGGVVQIFTRPGAAGRLGAGDAARPATRARARARRSCRPGRVRFRRDGELPLRRVRRGPRQHGLARAQRLGARSRPGSPTRAASASRARSGRRGRQSRRGRRGDSVHGARLLPRGALRGARHLRALATRTTSTSLLGGRRVEAGVRRSGWTASPRRRTRRRSRRASPTRRSSATTRSPASRRGSAGRSTTRSQLRPQPRRPDDDDLGPRRPGHRDLRRVHRHGGPALRPPLDLRRAPGARAARLLALGGPALEGPRLGRDAASARRRSASSTTRSAGNPDLKPERSVSWRGRRRALRRETAAPRSRSSGTT